MDAKRFASGKLSLEFQGVDEANLLFEAASALSKKQKRVLDASGFLPAVLGVIVGNETSVTVRGEEVTIVLGGLSRLAIDGINRLTNPDIANQDAVRNIEAIVPMLAQVAALEQHAQGISGNLQSYLPSKT